MGVARPGGARESLRSRWDQLALAPRERPAGNGPFPVQLLPRRRGRHHARGCGPRPREPRPIPSPLVPALHDPDDCALRPPESGVGFDIGLSGRRRELAVLRARGVSIRGVWAFPAVEMSVIALLAALIGLASAILLSRLVLTLPLFWGQRSGVPVFIPPTEVAVSPLTVAVTLGFAWLLGWLASWRAFRFAMTKDIVSAFRAYHAHEVSIPHRSSRDFLIATVGVAGLLLLVSSGFLEAGSDLGAWLGFPTLILAPIGPFLLTIGLARYLTRGTTRGYRVLARAFRPFLGELEPLVDKNIRRAPRRASNIAMIVTFAVAFLVAMAIAVASSETYLNEETRRNTPSAITL